MKRVSAAEYAKEIGKSVSTARRRLEAMVREGKAKRHVGWIEHPINSERCHGGLWMPSVRFVEYSFEEGERNES